MPTENRSSNTDPRDVFIRLNPLGLGEAELRKDSTGFEDQRTHSDYLLFLAGYRESHPEPQHQGEPVAWMRNDGVVFHPAFLDQFGSEYKTRLQPLYTGADPGEVERHIARRMELAEQITEMYRQIKTLRTEKAEQHERFVAIGTLCDDTLDKYGQLQAKLAERDALLARSAKLARGMVSHPWAVEFARLAADIEQIGVSASAEPKAKPGVLEIEDCTFDNRPIPSGYTLGASAEPSAPLYPKCTVLKDANVRYSNSTAPVERHERSDAGKCLDGGDCGVGGICKWCPHARSTLEPKP